MEKLIEYGKSLGYDLRIVPNYVYVGYNQGLASFSLSNRFSDNQSFLARVLTSFNIQVKTGQLEQGGNWKNISRLLYSYGRFMVSSTGSGSFKKIRRKIHSYLLKDNFQGVNISGVILQELDLGEYTKSKLDLVAFGDQSYSIDIRLENTKSVNSLIRSGYITKKIPLEFTFDIGGVKRHGNSSDQIEWFEVEVDLISSLAKNQFFSIHIPDLLEMGLSGWVRDKKLEKLIGENNI